MNEFALIQRLTRSLPTNPSVVVGAGDDLSRRRDNDSSIRHLTFRQRKLRLLDRRPHEHFVATVCHVAHLRNRGQPDG